jgi:hypothetical protein
MTEKSWSYKILDWFLGPSIETAITAYRKRMRERSLIAGICSECSSKLFTCGCNFNSGYLCKEHETQLAERMSNALSKTVGEYYSRSALDTGPQIAGRGIIRKPGDPVAVPPYGGSNETL